MKQMLRTLDSEELTYQMAYDLCEAEDLAVMRGASGAPPDPVSMPSAAPPGLITPPSPERLAAKLEQMWRAMAR